MLEESKIKRLGLVKYLYATGVQQSNAPDPMCSISLLTFHDAIEMYLQVASEHLDAGKEKLEFIGYWDVLTAKMSPKTLTQKESARRLNKARVALKHHGTLPSKHDMQSFRVITENIFIENTKNIFGVEFDEISLCDLVACERARITLKEAIQYKQDKKYKDSALKSAAAFKQLIHDYEERKIGFYGQSPFLFGDSFSFSTSSQMGLRSSSEFMSSSHQQRAMADFVDKAARSLSSIQDVLRIISLGIDYRKYTKFKLLTPHLQSAQGGYFPNWGYKNSDERLTVTEVDFCIDFVIESAIRIQDFDYDFKELIRQPPSDS